MATDLLAGINTTRIVNEKTLLNAVTDVGAGDPVNAGFECSHYSWHIKVTGDPTGVSVTLEGSRDNGTTWNVLDTSTTTTEEIRHVKGAGKEALLVRGNLGTLTGGTSPTVTVTALLCTIGQV